jgi:hypothetical protein
MLDMVGELHINVRLGCLDLCWLVLLGKEVGTLVIHVVRRCNGGGQGDIPFC